MVCTQHHRVTLKAGVQVIGCRTAANQSRQNQSVAVPTDHPWPALVEGGNIKRGNVASEAYKHSVIKYLE